MSKIMPVIKLEYVKRYLRGEGSYVTLGDELGVQGTSIQDWVRNYEAIGSGAFEQSKNKKYSKEFKEIVVKEYLSGQGSHREICKKHQIKSTKQLRDWIKKYNSHEELKTSNTGGKPIMTKGRKTTFEERVIIVKYCIEHNHNYNQTAKEFQISYQQARNYTVKYETDGVEGLRDRRGKRKSEEEMTEVEKLRVENKLLKAEKKQAEMELSFLKKLEEIERRRD